MFNFFSEVKEELSGKVAELIDNYHIVNISGAIIYVEGHLGLLNLSPEVISFKIKGGIVVVEGSELCLRELSDRTMKIFGKIRRVETF